MQITQDGREDIDQYYTNNPRQLSLSESSYDPKWYRFTPYDIKETINWIIKMLVLPGAISILIVVYVTFLKYTFGNHYKPNSRNLRVTSCFLVPFRSNHV